MRRVLFVGVGLLLTALLAMDGALATVLATPEPVITGRGDQYWPAATATGLAWVESRKDLGQHVYIRNLRRHRPIKVDRTGWSSSAGSFSGSHTLIYQQYKYTRRGSLSDLYRYDTNGGHHHRIPAPVSTSEWEYLPSASSRAILFLRCYLDRKDRCRRRALLMYDRQSPHKVRTLIRDIGPRPVYPGYAGLRYVAWTECDRANNCEVRFYDFINHTFHRLSPPAGMEQYAPAIDEDANLIYFVQSDAGCGRNVSVRRATLGSNVSTAVASFPRGIDTGYTLSLAPTTDGHQDLYYERYACQSEDGDVYALRDVDLL